MLKKIPAMALIQVIHGNFFKIKMAQMFINTYKWIASL